MARLAGVLTRLPRYLNLAQRLARDAHFPARRKVALAPGSHTSVSPVDLIPGIIPVLGQLDDLTALLLGLRQALDGCSDESRAAHLDGVGLKENALDADLRTVAVVAMWLGVEAVRIGSRAVGFSLRTLSGASSSLVGRFSHA